MGGEESLIAATMSRLTHIAEWADRYVVAGEHHKEGVITHCPSLPEGNLLVEPCARNTAPCVALAAHHIASRDPQGVIILLPADHHISDISAFQTALLSAIEGAREGKIMTLGVVPTRAETGYGYIKYPGGGLDNQSRLSVERFVEKPPKRVAEEYLASGQYLWNSGVFIFGVERILTELTAQLPKLMTSLAPVRAAIEALDEAAYTEALDEAFMEIKGVSIDVGVMEGADELEVIPLRAGWSDVGHWGALSEVNPVDEHHNVLIGHPEHLALNSREVTVYSDRFTAVVGLEGVVVVNTDDATLVCARESAQDVRLVIERLRHKGLKELT